jgi:hypothetical protein
VFRNDTSKEADGGGGGAKSEDEEETSMVAEKEWERGWWTITGKSNEQAADY